MKKGKITKHTNGKTGKKARTAGKAARKIYKKYTETSMRICLSNVGVFLGLLEIHSVYNNARANAWACCVQL